MDKRLEEIAVKKKDNRNFIIWLNTYKGGRLIVKSRKTGESFTALFDNEDKARLKAFNWFPAFSSGKRYLHACLGRENGMMRHKLMHRLILNLDDPKIFVDHINHNTLDNRKINLRESDSRANQCNRVDNKTGFPCVRATRNRWVSVMSINGKSTYLGAFKDKYSAALIVWKKGKELFGEKSPYKKPSKALSGGEEK